MKNLTSFLKYQSISFGNNIDKEKIQSTRLVVILGSLLYGLYSVIDYFGLPKETLMVLYPPRIVNFMFLLLIFTLTFKQELFLKHYNKILTFGYSITAVAICLGIYIAQEGDYSYGLYFAALMGLIFMSFNWSYLPLKNTLIMSGLIIITYTLIKVNIHNDTSSSHFLSFIAQIFYLISVVTVAVSAQIIRDNLIKRNIALQDKLKIIALEKIEEVKKQRTRANLDVLTGIPNRRYITECLREALIKAEQNDTQLTLLFIDLNGFKSINDTYGHDAGDSVLEITAKRIKNIIRKEDYLARLGGDEFLLGFESCQSSETIVEAYSEKLRENIKAPIAFNGQSFSVGTSIGVANYPSDATDIETLIKVADQKMYIDKHQIKTRQEQSLIKDLA